MLIWPNLNFEVLDLRVSFLEFYQILDEQKGLKLGRFP